MTNFQKERAGSALICVALAGLAAAAAKAGGPDILWGVCAICCGCSGLIASGRVNDSLSPEDEATLDRDEDERLQEAASDRRPWLSADGVVVHDGGPDRVDGAPSDGWLV